MKDKDMKNIVITTELEFIKGKVIKDICRAKVGHYRLSKKRSLKINGKDTCRAKAGYYTTMGVTVTDTS